MKIPSENQGLVWKTIKFSRVLGPQGRGNARDDFCAALGQSLGPFKNSQKKCFSNSTFFPSDLLFSSKFSTPKCISQFLRKPYTKAHIDAYLARVWHADQHRAVTGEKRIFRTKTIVKHDFMKLKCPPMLHTFSEKTIDDIKTGYDVQKPLKMHRFSWKMRAF